MASAPQAPGDFNHDGAVDGADYVVWRKNPGGVYTPDDYNTWRANFGRTFFTTGSGATGSAFPPSAFRLGQRHPRTIDIGAVDSRGDVPLSRAAAVFNEDTLTVRKTTFRFDRASSWGLQPTGVR